MQVKHGNRIRSNKNLKGTYSVNGTHHHSKNNKRTLRVAQKVDETAPNREINENLFDCILSTSNNWKIRNFPIIDIVKLSL